MNETNRWPSPRLTAQIPTEHRATAQQAWILGGAESFVYMPTLPELPLELAAACTSAPEPPAPTTRLARSALAETIGDD